MYENKYVKKKKRRIAVAIGTGVSATGVGALAIVAFLGRFVGTFTVSLNAESVELSLSEKSSFKNPTTHLMIDYLPSFEECTYSVIHNEESNVDNEELHYNDQGPANINTENNEVTSLNYFKYTFFVKNVGEMSAAYTVSYNIIENKTVTDVENGVEIERSLLDTMRVAIYCNEASSESHESKVYAQKAKEKHVNEEGQDTWQEYIARSDDEYGFAEMFDSDNRIHQDKPVYNFQKDDVNRYTIVIWLEGEDPQSVNHKEAPKGASVKLGVEINAYEN